MTTSAATEAHPPIAVAGHLEVWAPRAGLLEVVVGEVRTPMVSQPRGWWSSGDLVLAAGTDYSFSIDGGPPRPDPRSAHQPHGVHGASRVVDHSTFSWTDGEWTGRPLAGSVIYELHIGTFTPEGTFDAAIGHLDHLVELGIGMVQLMPVAEFPGRRGWGYDGVALFAPHAAYGGPDALKRFVDACHRRGLGVLVDVVYNHLGPSGNYLAEYAPYFTDRHTTPWGQAVNFDGRGSDEVRAFVFDNARMWLRDYHFDGLRLDAVHAIHDESAVHVLAELGDRVRRLEPELGRQLVVVAESDLNDPRVVEPRELGGWGLDAQWSDDFHHSLHAVLTGERFGYYGDFGAIRHVADALRQGLVYVGDYSAFRDRSHGRPLLAGTSGDSLLGYLQTHDQVGNRALGERIGRLADPARVRVAAALVLTSPFVPMIFSGEEWGAVTPFHYFIDHAEPELADAVRAGRAREFESFGWPMDQVDPQDPATMAACILDWSDLDDPAHGEMLAWYRLLIDLRARYRDLGCGVLGAGKVEFDESGWLMIRRGEVVVAANLGSPTHELTLEPACSEVLAASGGPTLEATSMRLPPDSVIIAR